MKKTPLYGIIVPFILLSACQKNDKQGQENLSPEVPVTLVKQVDTLIYTEYPVKLEGYTDVEIHTQISGILEKIFVEEGSYVEKGQALFQIDTRLYQEAHNQAKAELMAAKAQVSSAKLEVEKLSSLVQQKVVSDYQLKTATIAYDTALAIEMQALARTNNTAVTLSYATIKAPVSGYFGRLTKKTGSLVGPTDPQPLSYLSDNRKVHAYFSISENDFSQLKEGLTGESIAEKLRNASKVPLLLSGGKLYPYSGTLDMVDAAFDKTTGAITLRATYPNEEGLLRSGNSGRIRLGVRKDGVIAIPQSATFELQDKTFAFVVDKGNIVKQVALTITGKDNNSYYVAQGIKEGDNLVLKDLESLKDGQSVKVLKPDENRAK